MIDWLFLFYTGTFPRDILDYLPLHEGPVKSFSCQGQYSFCSYMPHIVMKVLQDHRLVFGRENQLFPFTGLSDKKSLFQVEFVPFMEELACCSTRGVSCVIVQHCIGFFQLDNLSYRCVFPLR